MPFSHRNFIAWRLGGGNLAAVQNESVVAKIKARNTKLPAFLMKKSRDSGAHPYLISPVTGDRLAVSRFQQLFLLALSNGKKQPAEWREFAWPINR